MNIQSAILLDDGTPLFFGSNDDDQSKVPDLGGRKAIAISCGDFHSSIVFNDKVILFGENSNGQLNYKPEYVLFMNIENNCLERQRFNLDSDDSMFYNI